MNFSGDFVCERLIPYIQVHCIKNIKISHKNCKNSKRENPQKIKFKNPKKSTKVSKNSVVISITVRPKKYTKS